MDPATAAAVAVVVAEAAKKGSEYFANKKEERGQKRKAKELKRETHAESMSAALDRSRELKEKELKGRAAMGKRRAHSLQDTSDLVRRALAS